MEGKLIILPILFYAAFLVGQNPIFSGGTGDGFHVAFFEQPSNNTIFAGADADGFSSMEFTQIANNPIYKGGTADGFSNILYKQKANNTIFIGGNADGFSDNIYGQPVNNPIYAGGHADGFSMVVHAQQLNNNIFAGGDGDGFNIQVYQTTFSEVAIKVILQGPFDPNTGLMRRDLSAGGADDDIPLPVVEPYSSLGYMLQNSGVSIVTSPGFSISDVVDWLVVELRDLNSNAYFARTALLLEDGSVADNQFSPSVKFRNIPAGNYHVAIRHRNHLGVMTQTSVLIINE